MIWREREGGRERRERREREREREMALHVAEEGWLHSAEKEE